MATCEDMCPAAEVRFRTTNRLINQLEATTSSSAGPRSEYVADPRKMIKEYSRSAAGTHQYKKPELLRPFAVLVRTVDYLFDLYSPFKDRLEAVTSSEFSLVFSFVSDRLRAVRQDMTMQNMRGKNAVILMEMMLPFYIETDGLCKMRICHSFEQKLHDFQLEECFARWHEEITSSSIAPDPQIAACFFFRQLHRNPALLHELYTLQLKIPIKTFPLIRNFICSFQSNNYRRFFVEFYQLEPLLKHSLSDAVASLRLSAIRTISVAFKTPMAKLPSRLLSDWLGFPSNLEHIDQFLRLCSTSSDDAGNVLIASIKPAITGQNIGLSIRQYK